LSSGNEGVCDLLYSYVSTKTILLFSRSTCWTLAVGSQATSNAQGAESVEARSDDRIIEVVLADLAAE